jgi:D-aminoacyl-tRNA deacylase
MIEYAAAKVNSGKGRERMIIVLQRVKEAWVEVEGRATGRIGPGICLLVGVEKGDTLEDAEFLARKSTELRIFPDKEGKMNLSLGEAGGEVLAVSQFTLAGSTRKGRRPSFDGAEQPATAAELFDRLVALIREKGFRVETGVFQAMMDVHLTNDGPVTFILESCRSRGGSGALSR